MAQYAVKWDAAEAVWYGQRNRERVWDRRAISGAENQDIWIEGGSKREVKDAVLTEARWERNRTNRRQKVQMFDKRGRRVGSPRIIEPFTDCRLPT